jgi:hypothetical protein
VAVRRSGNPRPRVPTPPTGRAARHFIQDERPGHHEAVIRTPAEYEVPLRLERDECATVFNPVERREDHPARQILQIWDDTLLASLTLVVEEIVAVPTRSTARAHLREPGPDILCGSLDGDGVRQRGEWLSDSIVARQWLQLLGGSAREQLLMAFADELSRRPYAALCVGLPARAAN